MEVVPEIQFTGIDNPNTNAMVCLVKGTADEHTLLYEDRLINPNRINYLSVIQEDTNFEDSLRTTWLDLPLSFRLIARALILNDGLDLDLMGTDRTCGEVISFILHRYLLNQHILSDKAAPTLPDRPRRFGHYLLF
ncbi:MAG: hypothetical protein AB1589_23095 [Cyanobacteriota bacterium]